MYLRLNLSALVILMTSKYWTRKSTEEGKSFIGESFRKKENNSYKTNTRTMKHIPILFSTEMVRAIDEGRKTVTRRMKGLKKINENPDRHLIWNHKDHDFITFDYLETLKDEIVKKPFREGDILWVREKFRELIDCRTGQLVEYDHYADMPENFGDKLKNQRNVKWKPSIFMPKEACRTFLEVTGVRVEKLQSITSEDAIKEGIERLPGGNWKNYFSKVKMIENWENPYHSFKSLWEEINGSDSWDANPWVWVVDFKKTDKPQNWPE